MNCNHMLCNMENGVRELEPFEVEQIIACLVEQGEIKVVGYGEKGQAKYKTVEQEA